MICKNPGEVHPPPLFHSGGGVIDCPPPETALGTRPIIGLFYLPHQLSSVCTDCLWGFCGFFLLRHFLVMPTLSICSKLFPFWSTCRLLPCPYYSPLMHFGLCHSCLLCIQKVLGTHFLCVNHPKCPLQGWYQKHSHARTRS